MNNCAAIGFTSFRLNLKRGSFLVFVLMISMMFGLFMYRRGTSPEFSETSVKMLSKFMGYYLIFISAGMFSKEFQNGFYKCVHTSGLSESRIILYKTLSVLFTALLLFAALTAVHLSVAASGPADADLKLLGRGAVIFLIASLHYSSAAAILMAMLNSYRTTFFSMIICYIALPYVYIMYRSFTGHEAEVICAVPFISLDNVMMTYEIRLTELAITVIMTAVFFAGAVFIARNRDIKTQGSGA